MIVAKASLYGAALLAAGLAVTSCGSQARSAEEWGALQARVTRIEADSAKPGRYQVVNGLPSMARHIKLLDTETGRTWELCDIAGDAKAP
jgi:hypothetical protein